jgi:CDP-paratose 2-epimerase
MTKRQRAGRNGHGFHGMQSITLVTGGAGFIGSNLADALLQRGHAVMILDNMSRPGVEHNVSWLRSRHGKRLGLMVGDVRDTQTLAQAVKHASCIYHFAAQVAVTTSCRDPIGDFEVNARGTLNVLTAMRELKNPPPLIFTSTNKVYGALDDVALRSAAKRYEPEQEGIRAKGIDETRSLDFHSPYGCSKGVADQYVLDFARCFGLDTVVLRMSCIYGGRQFGNEEQGWVAHLMRQAEARKAITIYGDGKQVRDILHVEDLVHALMLAREHIDNVRGQAFNIGGGAENALSLLELLNHIEHMHGHTPAVRFSDWRLGDQRYYVSDYTKYQASTGWQPKVDITRGLARLYAWVRELSRTKLSGGFGKSTSSDNARAGHSRGV